MTWHVVADPLASNPQPEDRIWTLSRDPGHPGWCTDGGFGGYGLKKADAQELADAANKLLNLSLEEKLKEMRDLKVGQPLPRWLTANNNNWGDGISELCGHALAEIERLQLKRDLKPA